MGNSKDGLRAAYEIGTLGLSWTVTSMFKTGSSLGNGEGVKIVKYTFSGTFGGISYGIGLGLGF